MYQGKETKFTKSEYYYRGIKVIDWLGCDTNNHYVSLIKFLSDNEDDYPEAPLKLYNTINQFGI
jgi:hypothetical protein